MKLLPQIRLPRYARLPRSGLTAVELLVATALSAMLMTAILGLLGTLNTHCRQLIQDTQVEPWEPLLAEQLRRDLANARQVTAGQNQLVLTGYLGTRGPQLFATHRAAEVTYHIAVLDEVACLLRDERPLTAASRSGTSRRLVATGIDGFRLLISDGSQSTSPQTDDSYSGPVPKVCRVCFFDRQQTTPATEVLWCQ